MIFRKRDAGRYSCVLLLFAAACSTAPAGPSGASGESTGSIAAPRPVSPATNAVIRNQDQPVVLVVSNAVVTKPGGTTYTFEVATDLGFASKVQTKDAVPEGTGTTAVGLDALPAGRDYYWHVRAQGAGTTGVFGTTFKFTVGPAIAINAPLPIAPLTNAQTSPRPALRVANAVRTGPAGAITYRFEISTVSSFASILMTGTNSEGVNETGFIPLTDLPTSVILFWRAVAFDLANGVSSAPSAVQSFSASRPSQAETVAVELGQPLWPGQVPTGTVGHATMGNDIAFGAGWAIQTLYYAPGNVHFQSPDIEMLRLFDLLDRGFDPDGATAWMNQHGYPTQALWYPPPEKAVIGLRYVYIAARGKVSVNGIWDIVVRIE
jgi:hypothetical protein